MEGPSLNEIASHAITGRPILEEQNTGARFHQIFEKAFDQKQIVRLSDNILSVAGITKYGDRYLSHETKTLRAGTRISREQATEIYSDNLCHLFLFVDIDHFLNGDLDQDGIFHVMEDGHNLGMIENRGVNYDFGNSQRQIVRDWQKMLSDEEELKRTLTYMISNTALGRTKRETVFSRPDIVAEILEKTDRKLKQFEELYAGIAGMKRFYIATNPPGFSETQNRNTINRILSHPRAFKEWRDFRGAITQARRLLPRLHVLLPEVANTPFPDPFKHLWASDNESSTEAPTSE